MPLGAVALAQGCGIAAGLTWAATLQPSAALRTAASASFRRDGLSPVHGLPSEGAGPCGPSDSGLTAPPPSLCPALPTTGSAPQGTWASPLPLISFS